jgi:hypothetical protein
VLFFTTIAIEKSKLDKTRCNRRKEGCRRHGIICTYDTIVMIVKIRDKMLAAKKKRPASGWKP